MCALWKDRNKRKLELSNILHLDHLTQLNILMLSFTILPFTFLGFKFPPFLSYNLSLLMYWINSPHLITIVPCRVFFAIWSLVSGLTYHFFDKKPATLWQDGKFHSITDLRPKGTIRSSDLTSYIAEVISWCCICLL